MNKTEYQYYRRVCCWTSVLKSTLEHKYCSPGDIFVSRVTCLFIPLYYKTLASAHFHLLYFKVRLSHCEMLLMWHVMPWTCILSNKHSQLSAICRALQVLRLVVIALFASCLYAHLEYHFQTYSLEFDAIKNDTYKWFSSVLTQTFFFISIKYTFIPHRHAFLA